MQKLILTTEIKENDVYISLTAPPELVSGVDIAELPEKVREIVSCHAQIVEWIRMAAKKQDLLVTLRINNNMILQSRPTIDI